MRLGEFFTFSGRVGRGSFWLTFVIVTITSSIGWYMAEASESDGMIGLGAILVIISLVASLANQVKRLHDRNHSGFWLLFSFIPFFGWIIVLVQVGLMAGETDANMYGVPGSGSPYSSPQPLAIEPPSWMTRTETP